MWSVGEWRLDHPDLYACRSGGGGGVLGRSVPGLGHEFLLEGKDSDVRDLEAVYAGNGGCFLVAEMGGRIVGTVGVRLWSEDVAELKRLYVAPAWQGRGIGEALCLRAIGEAWHLGYRALRLDTTRRAMAALALFGRLGFREIPRYNEDVYAEVFLERVLEGDS